MFHLKAMPSTPMTEAELLHQCEMVSATAKADSLATENEEVRVAIVSEAVGKAIAIGRPFDSHWYYYLPIEDRKYFNSVHEFVLLCDLHYREVI